jgi:hypothetical protein
MKEPVPGVGRRRPVSRGRFARPLFVLLLAGCAAAPPPAAPPAAPSAPGPAEAARHRAALATLHVENRTAHRITISFRPATPPGGAVGVGVVGGGTSALMAPVPAGESIFLTARTATGGWLEIGPRTFDVDEAWVWTVPADARFETGGDA